MSVGIHVGTSVFELGAASFFNSFFSTVCNVLEHGQWGTRFPTTMRVLYSGTVPAEALPSLADELAAIRLELAGFPPSAVVWNIDDSSEQPPWGNQIAPTITTLAEYWVTSRGRDIFSELVAAIDLATANHKALAIE